MHRKYGLWHEAWKDYTVGAIPADDMEENLSKVASKQIGNLTGGETGNPIFINA